LCSTFVYAADTKPAIITPYVAGELLVRYKPSVHALAIQSSQKKRNIQNLRTFRKNRVHHVKLPKDMTVQEALYIYGSDPDVAYAEPNYYRHVAVFPNDTHFDRQWSLHNTGQVVNGAMGMEDADIDAPEAWDLTTGRPSVIVAVIDSGVDISHPDLSPNIWTNPGEIADNGLDDDSNGLIDDVIGWDYVNHDPWPDDPNGHGTHVAGIIAASGHDASGVSGIGWEAKIMVLRVVDAFGYLSDADAIEAIEYAESKGADIVNCSWASEDFGLFLKGAIEASSALFVCAAGNGNTENDLMPLYPASYESPHIISVAATDAYDELASFSNFGKSAVDVGAPGVHIYNCIPARKTIWSEDFDAGPINNWASGGTKNLWGRTTLSFFSAPYALSESPEGDYPNSTDAWIRMPVLNLSMAFGTQLHFKLNGVSESSYDRLFVETSRDAVNWKRQRVLVEDLIFPNGVSGSTLDLWLNAQVDLEEYDGAQTLYVRFRFISDINIQYDGWYIDDVTVTAASESYDGSEFGYLSGTSMATAHVSGIAALVISENPLLKNTEIKTVIEESVDPLSSLVYRVSSGGRVNAFQALSNVLDDVTIYEDAEDGRIDRWSVYAGDKDMALIRNTYDSQKQSMVIALDGDGTSNGYLLKNRDGKKWHNSTQRIIHWSMKYEEDFRILVEVETTAGRRYLSYSPVDFDKLGSGGSVHHGIGSYVKDGQWHTFFRDLQKDLEDAQPGLTILEINYFRIRGSGRLDDILLMMKEENHEKTVYENAEDGETNRWAVYAGVKNAPFISNIYDDEKQSQVIAFEGNGIDSGYLLKNKDGKKWHNKDQRIISWRMRYDEDFRIIVEVETTVGRRYLSYSPADHDKLGNGSSVHHGLGTIATDGLWRIFMRDLDQDLADAQPGVAILEVNYFRIRGSGRVDDISLSSDF
jgi:subtilisin family serine protease